VVNFFGWRWIRQLILSLGLFLDSKKIGQSLVQ
jgi:hypothetical protein